MENIYVGTFFVMHEFRLCQQLKSVQNGNEWKDALLQ